MRKLALVACVAVIGSIAAFPARGALTVTESNGVDSLTLAFDAAEATRELWCAWDDADKGADFAGWANSERVALVEAEAATLTVALPADARRAAFARFFLFAGGASYPCGYIRATDRAYIDTGYLVGPNSAVSVDYMMEDVITLQQRPFGAHGSTFVISAYINSAASWSWAFTDGASGNWTNTNLDFQKKRTVYTIDGPNDRISISYDGTEVYSDAMSAVVALDQRTATCDVSLFLFAQHNASGTASNFGTLKFYGATIDEAGARVRTYEPYVSEGAAGVRDAVGGTFLANANTERGALIPCGRGGDVSGAEAGEALDLDAVRGGPAEPETVYVNVASGKVLTFDGPATIDYTLVKIGAGTLVLEGTRTFNGDVIVSNGTIRADYETCGLKGTHLVLATSDSSYAAYLQITGNSFTAPIATNGPGTVEFGGGYAGIVPYEQDITLNFFGDGRTLRRMADGFNLYSFLLTNSSTTRNATLVNGIDINGNDFEIKGGGSGTAFYTGIVTNSTATSKNLNFYGGKQVVVGTRGMAGERVDVYGYHLQNYASTLIFSNAVIRTTSDLLSGVNNSNVGRTTLVNCDRRATGGWDYAAGKAGSSMVIDGGTHTSPGHFRVGHYGGGREGTLIVTNGATVTFGNSLGIYTNSVYRQYSGIVRFGTIDNVAGLAEIHGGTLTFTNGNCYVGKSPGRRAALAIYGGALEQNNNKSLQIGVSGGNGWMHQTGGTVTVGYYFSVGRGPASAGRFDVHGGTFTHRNNQYIRIGEQGTGVVSVANGGTFTDLSPYSPMTYNAAGKGTLFLSPDGTFETPGLSATGAGRDSSVVFNGGTLKLRTNGYASSFLSNDISRVTVSPYGGAIDTNGKGDFTLSRALGPTTDAGDLSEALAHRWSFDGSAADSIGGSDAELVGTAYVTNGMVRLTGTSRGGSCVNLGTALLPTDGRGATIELWVTPLSYKSWARVIAFGSGNGTVKDIYLSFNRGSNASPGAAHFRIYGSGTDIDTNKALLPGNTYHVAVVLDPQPDGTFLNTAYVHDAETGELYTMVQEATSVGWTPAEVAQENGCWLGHSNSTSNPDPDALYHEVRVHHRPMSAEQVQASCAAGPDAVYYFRKKGEGTLTMTGANTYAAGTAVDAGTLKLAAGATLPATEMWADAGATLDLNGTSQTAKELGGTGTVKGGTLAVTGTIQPGGRKAVGTLALDGTALASGTLVADTAADGTSDRLAVTGTLDLSKLSFALGADSALDEKKVYTIATATTVTGNFATVDAPKKWRISILGSQVKLVYANGTVVFFR